MNPRGIFVVFEAQSFLPLPDVMAQTGLGRTSIYKYISDGTFPRHVKIGKRSLWVASEIQKWMATAMAARNISRK
jgi:prophage regulatory protein